MASETVYILVQISTGSEAQAQSIAWAVIEQRLAACAQILPIRSYYKWEEKMIEDAEFLLLLKTRADRFAELEECVKALHSYQVPEIIALPIVAGSAAYLQWIDDTLAR